MQILIHPGTIDGPKLLDRSESAKGENSIAGILVREKELRNAWQHVQNGPPIWTTQEIEDHQNHLPEAELHREYDDILGAILTDLRTTFLAERWLGSRGSQSAFNNTIKCEIMCWNALSILSTLAPDRLVQVHTPHLTTVWVFSRAAELLGIPVIMTTTSCLPRRERIVLGVDQQKPIHLEESNQRRSEPSPEVLARVQLMRGVYDEAMPEYERRRMDAYGGKFWNWKAELRTALKGTFVQMSENIVHMKRKHMLLQQYQRLARDFKLPRTFATFFLHYQPERSSCPEGYSFAQQWLAIRLLATALQKRNLDLVVKEHPSMYRNPWIGADTRSRWLYEAISSLPNASLAPLDASPFDLIDNAMAVATLTGTVGMESLCRGKPALVFGAASYRGLRGVHEIKTQNDVENALDIIMSCASPVASLDAITSFLAHLEENSFAIEDDERHSTEAFAVAMQLNNSQLARDAEPLAHY